MVHFEPRNDMVSSSLWIKELIFNDFFAFFL